MARRRFPGRFVRPAPKTKVWIGAGLAASNLAPSAETFLSSLNAAALALRPFTILRTRLDIFFTSDQSVASEVPAGVYGRIVVQEEAAAVGITALPGPIGQSDADWFVYEGMTTSFLFKSGVGIEAQMGVRYVVDSKAMRKVGSNETIAVVFELRTAAGGTINVEGRTLVQLH